MVCQSSFRCGGINGGRPVGKKEEMRNIKEGREEGRRGADRRGKDRRGKERKGRNEDGRKKEEGKDRQQRRHHPSYMDSLSLCLSTSDYPMISSHLDEDDDGWI